jgi:hypothetical protein
MFLPRKTNYRKGIALLEVMIATALLTLAVTSITSAIVAGQQQSLEARTKIVGSIAAESFLSQISQEPWESLNSWHGYIEEIGTIVDPTGIPLDGDWESIGRSVSVIDSEILIESLEVYILGRTVTVTSFTNGGRIITTVDRFIPEPQL